MGKFLLAVATMVALSGCASQRCEKVRAYQKTVATVPITVPSDLSTPQVRSRAPAVEPDTATRRADGRCLDAPPVFQVETEEDGEVPAEKTE